MRSIRSVPLSSRAIKGGAYTVEGPLLFGAALAADVPQVDEVLRAYARPLGTAFQPGDANYSFIVPNQCHSAHDCKITQADTWLAGFAPKILDSDAFKAGGLLVVTFDEGGGSDPGGGHIATIVISPDVPAGFRADTPYDHYSLLRTVEDAWGLGCLADACAAQPMTEFFDGA